MSKNVVNFVGIVGDWDERADEHILIMRNLNELEGTSFEFVHVIKDPLSDNDNQVLFRHGVQFVGDLDLENPDICRWLDAQARCFGYGSFDDCVQEYSPSKVDFRYKADGRPDRYDNPTYVVDYMALAAMLIEASAETGDLAHSVPSSSITMSREEALRLVKKITDFDYEEV